MEIVYKNLGSIIPYENNPRINDPAVDAVAASIREFGFKVPVVIDRMGVIVAGHTRVKAAEKLGMTQVPCVIADDLTDEQVRAFRLADNKTGELAGWDFEKLEAELEALKNIDMTAMGFEKLEGELHEWFTEHERNDTSRQEGNEEYNEFLDKFEPKKTTDDCYTPDNIYDAVADWVANEYKLDRRRFVRPFYPGGGLRERGIQARGRGGRQSALLHPRENLPVLHGAGGPLLPVCADADHLLSGRPRHLPYMRTL